MILFKGGKYLKENKIVQGDILTDKGIIVKTGENLKDKAEEVVDCKNLTILPGLFDMHSHLREPGFEYKENIESGTLAAARGGFTAVACMPNTNPVLDSAPLIEFVKNKADKIGNCKVYPIGAITKGQNGAEITEMGELKESGAAALSDDGKPVEKSNVMYNALKYAKTMGILLISHCEDTAFSDGVVNEGYSASVSGLKGIPAASENIMVSRDILLAEELNTSVHLAHISTAGSVDIIRQAKKRGVKVTCETCPHYFSAEDSFILEYDTNAKVNPPLRSQKDVEAIIAGIKDGTIDVIATDHAPHHVNDKNVEFNYAANGISGLETAFMLSYTNLVKVGHITIEKLVELTAFNPAKILKIKKEGIKENAAADFFIADLEKKVKIDAGKFLSKGKNTPFSGTVVYGDIKCTVYNGRLMKW